MFENCIFRFPRWVSTQHLNGVAPDGFWDFINCAWIPSGTTTENFDAIEYTMPDIPLQDGEPHPNGTGDRIVRGPKYFLDAGWRHFRVRIWVMEPRFRDTGQRERFSYWVEPINPAQLPPY